ncbi:MAG: ABC transporter ATP-binding protein [Nitrososphaerota archaeon]|nr:ABC transporter ATP-binding protein [Nitrososphaerota archaeon]
MVEVKNAVKKFGSYSAVNNVSFQIHRAEIFSMIGPSGCGKTTLLRSIAGLEDIDEGEIYVAGKLVSSASKKLFVQPEHRGLGLVFQSYALWPHMSVHDNIAMGLKARKIGDVERRVKSSLELVGLPTMEKRYPAQLSGGEQQRVALARSLAYEPKVILLDEPLSNLDFKERERVRVELKILLKKIGITTLYVTHDQEEAFVMSDNVAIMNKGVIVQRGNPAEIYEQPANSWVANFIGRANIYKASLQKSNGTGSLISVPDLRGELTCTKGGVTEQQFSVMIRPNELGISTQLPNENGNILKGTVVAREYKGSTVDHILKVGDANLVVTTHRFCRNANVTGNNVYVHVPPEAVTIIPN